jgi:hypothetical protein
LQAQNALNIPPGRARTSTKLTAKSARSPDKPGAGARRGSSATKKKRAAYSLRATNRSSQRIV